MRLTLATDHRDVLCPQDRPRLWQCLRDAILVQDRARAILGLLHIRLIEGVDAEQRPSHRRCELPAKELATQIVGIVQRQRHHRMPSSFQRR